MINETKQAIDKLWAILINFEWFADRIEVNPYLHKSLVVYVDTMNKSILDFIPDTIDGFDVRVHYAASINEKYAAKLPSNKSANLLVDLVASMEITSFEN